MQNLIKCPAFLQFGQMLAQGGKDASRAVMHVMGDDGKECALDVWDGNVLRMGNRLGNAR